jgi:hypothetical protein
VNLVLRFNSCHQSKINNKGRYKSATFFIDMVGVTGFTPHIPVLRPAGQRYRVVPFCSRQNGEPTSPVQLLTQSMIHKKSPLESSELLL